MGLNREELIQISGFLHNYVDVLPDELLEKMELGIWIFQPSNFLYGQDYGYLPVYEPMTENSQAEPLFLSGRFGLRRSQRILTSFRNRLIPYMLVRVESWECYISCNGEILSEHCEENLDAVREACERLRKRCSADLPSVHRIGGG